jgi:hypothetical protein
MHSQSPLHRLAKKERRRRFSSEIGVPLMNRQVEKVYACTRLMSKVSPANFFGCGREKIKK